MYKGMPVRLYPCAHELGKRMIECLCTMLDLSVKGAEIHFRVHPVTEDVYVF